MSLGKMILKKKKAVSPVIATILLIALTVTAAAIVYFVVVPLFAQKAEISPISYGTEAGYNDRVYFEVKNIGGAAATFANLDAFVVTNTSDSSTYTAIHVFVGTTEIDFTTPYELAQGATVKFSIQVDGFLLATATYEITLTHADGSITSPAF